MKISDATKAVFFTNGERAGWEAVWREQIDYLMGELLQCSPENLKEIHRIQMEIHLFRTEFPRVRQAVDEYVAQRAILPEPTGQ